MRLTLVHKILHLFGHSDAWMVMEETPAFRHLKEKYGFRLSEPVTLCGRCGHRR